MTNGSLMKVESIAEFFNTFDIQNQYFVFLRVVILHRFYCIYNGKIQWFIGW